jgi:hypothetical protein
MSVLKSKQTELKFFASPSNFALVISNLNIIYINMECLISIFCISTIYERLPGHFLLFTRL